MVDGVARGDGEQPGGTAGRTTNASRHREWIVDIVTPGRPPRAARLGKDNDARMGSPGRRVLARRERLESTAMDLEKDETAAGRIARRVEAQRPRHPRH